MSTPDEIFDAANLLSPTDKWLLVTRLWATLPPEAWDEPDESEIALFDQRMAEIESGEVETIPWDEVCKQMHTWLSNHG
jgi:putative addiction module component (TIGR02574 family)